MVVVPLQEVVFLNIFIDTLLESQDIDTAHSAVVIDRYCPCDVTQYNVCQSSLIEMQ